METNIKSRKLIFNILLFFIGGMGAKLLQFVLLPMYTRVLSNSEYGTVDLFQTVGTLLLPVVTICIAEAVFRFGMDCSISSYIVLKQSLFIATIGLGVGCFIIGIVYCNYNRNLVLLLFSTHLIMASYKTILSQYVRSQKRIKLYITDNLFQTFIICTVNIVAVAYFKLGIWGYFSGYIFANSFSIIFLSYKIKLIRNIKQIGISLKIIKRMLSYSIPLIPNSICWWISNSLDRVMVSVILGVSQNGILAVVYKIPNMITLMFDFFIQAWQISINEEIDSGQKSDFHNDVFKYVSVITCIICFWAMLISNYILPVIVGQSFVIAQRYIPIFSLAIVFFVFAQYLGTFFSAYKKTDQAFYTNLIAAVVNVILNMLLIPEFGLYGAGVATLCSYIILWFIRTIKIRKLTVITYPHQFWYSLAILCCQTILISIGMNISALCLEVILFVLNSNTIRELFRIKSRGNYHV